MIRQCEEKDFWDIHGIINDAARAYKGAIPVDCWKEPYMPEKYLRREIEAGVSFWGFEQREKLIGVMGVQDAEDVMLIRHAYVKTGLRNHGIGGQLISHLKELTEKPVLVGTWEAATWAIRFYEKHGFKLVSEEEKNRLLREYWTISERQVETSVVLADEKWISKK